jgi:DNA-binding response OmpR family regulator
MAKGRVLLAHGNSDCQKIYGSVLTYEGYYVEVVDDGEVAFNALATLHFDLVVSDLYLKASADECLLRRVRASSFGVHLPFVVITGWTTEPHRRLASDEQADAFLPLPVRPRQLVEIVADLLEQPRQSISPKRATGDQPDHSIANGL